MRILFLSTVCCIAQASMPAHAERFILQLKEAEALFLLANPISSPQSASGEPDMKDPAQRKDFAMRLLGLGYDFWADKAIPNKCVDFSEAFVQFIPAVPAVPSSDNWSKIIAVQRFAEHAANQSSGGSVSLTYKAFSLGASHAAAQSNHFSSYSGYISVDKGLLGDTAKLVPPGGGETMSPSAIALDAIKKSGSEFSRICGQSYVSRVSLGAHIVGTLDYSTTMNQAAAANSTAVSAAVAGIVSGAFSTAEQYADLATKATLDYQVRGGPAKDPEPAKWLASIRDYGADGNFNYSNTAVIIETTGYSTLPNPEFAEFVDADKLGQGTVGKFQSDFMTSVQLLSDLMFAQAHPAQFAKSKPEDVATQVKAVSDYIDAAGKVYEDCRRAVDKNSAQVCEDGAKTLQVPSGIARPELSPPPT